MFSRSTSITSPGARLEGPALLGVAVGVGGEPQQHRHPGPLVAGVVLRT